MRKDGMEYVQEGKYVGMHVPTYPEHLCLLGIDCGHLGHVLLEVAVGSCQLQRYGYDT